MLQLPAEVWSDLACCTPRAYLDDMLTWNRSLTGGIYAVSEPHDQRHAPRRRTLLQGLRCVNGSLVVRLTGYARDADPNGATSNFTGPHVDCYNAEQLHVAVENRWITDLSFETMNADLHNTLMRIAAPRWQGASTLHGHGSRYADKDTFMRLFEELVVGVGLIALDFTENLSFDVEPQHFWNLEAIRHCDILRVDRLPPSRPRLELTSEQALRWLRIPPRDMALKRLEIRQEALAHPIDVLLLNFQQDFVTVSDERPPVTYRVTVFLRNDFVGKAVLKNQGTGEVLEYYAEPSSADILVIFRHMP